MEVMTPPHGYFFADRVPSPPDRRPSRVPTPETTDVMVIGGTGTIGSHVVPQLLASGARVGVLTRSAARGLTVRRPAVAVVGDLSRQYTLRGLFEGRDTLVLITAHSIAETGEGLAAVAAAEEAGVRRVVFVSAASCSAALRIPHMASKSRIEAALTASRLDYTIIRAHHLFQNDASVETRIAAGEYPLPIGNVGISRIDGRDVADVIARVITQRGHSRRIYTIGSDKLFTGPSVAAEYAAGMRTSVTYAGDDLDRWEKLAGASLPKWKRDDLKMMFRHFQERGLVMTQAALEEQQRLLPALRSFEDYVHSVCREWRISAEL